MTKVNYFTDSIHTREIANDTIQNDGVNNSSSSLYKPHNKHKDDSLFISYNNTAHLDQNKALALTIYPDSVQNDSSIIAVDSFKQTVPDKPIELFQLTQNEKSSFDYKPSKVFIERDKSELESSKKIDFQTNLDYRSHLNWALLLGLISISLFIGLKIYYQKFLNQVINTTINFQLAEKMLREKNILARRAFFMLNLNYLLVFSLLLTLFFITINFTITKKYYLDYLIITLGVLTILLIRLGIIYLNGYLFQMMTATLEYIHSIYLINKNLGIVLLPLVFLSIYSPPVLSKIFLIMGISAVSIATFFKIIRGFQIIMKNRVLLFYSFLYLCTLELLPLALGSKLIIALR